jgi:hypothetical protein
MLGLQIAFTLNQEEYLSSELPKFCYGICPEGEMTHIAAHDLLFETGISVKSLKYFEFDGLPAFFATFNPKSILPFDLFAASFFLVSRYEEYLPHIRDEHGRFPAHESEAFRNGFLDRPMINIWANRLGEMLSQIFPELKVSRLPFRFIPTVDIDIAYAFKHRGLTRTVGGMIKSFQAKKKEEIIKRINVLLNRQKDPFDTFGYMLDLFSSYSLKPVFFFLMADYGERDKNLPVNNRQFLHLIRFLSDYAEIGIHPSYASAFNPEKIETEIRRLSKVLHQDITLSRQHFLRLEFPGTYRNLINNEITDDFTMGYPDLPGFRASIASAFPFYDLDLDVKSSLRIHPFAVMDGTLNDYMAVSPDRAVEIINELILEVSKSGGDFISVWHNQSFSEEAEWSGWRSVYEKMIAQASEAC